MAAVPKDSDKHAGIKMHGTKGFSPGRCLRAARDYKPGQLMAVFDDPLVAFPDAAGSKTTCHHCLVHNAKVFGCTGCDKAVSYCSDECQKVNWKLIHSKECKVFRKVQAAVSKNWLPTPVRALVQILLRLSEVHEVVTGLEGHGDKFRARKELWENMKLQAYAGIHYAGRKEDDANLNLAAEILCKIQTNSFDRFDADTGQSGAFLDPLLAMVNHSCIPNAVVLFWKRKAYLRAETPVKAGEDITISYIDYTKPLSFRRQDLELYHFQCGCLRCEKDMDVYQVCRASPILKFNDATISPSAAWLASPPVSAGLPDQGAWRAQVEAIYAECVSTRTENPTANERLAKLRDDWRRCKPLVDAKLWALEPLAKTIQSATLYYLAADRLPNALATACLSVLYCDPVQYIAPFKQFRLTGLMLVAKVLTQTSVPDDESLAKDAHPDVVAVMSRSDQASMLHAVLLLVTSLAPKGHSPDWVILEEAKVMLSGIESIKGRESDAMLLRKCLANPGSDGPQMSFFRERVLGPFEELARLAPSVIAADVGS
ncbi:hypothetical protein RB597_009613 [Gaeumannomyces tritici]